MSDDGTLTLGRWSKSAAVCGLLGVAESSALLSQCILDDNKSSVVSMVSSEIIHDLTTLRTHKL